MPFIRVKFVGFLPRFCALYLFKDNLSLLSFSKLGYILNLLFAFSNTAAVYLDKFKQTTKNKTT